MPNSGPNNWGTSADNSAVGTVAWNSLGSPGTPQTTLPTNGSVSHYLVLTNFGFTTVQIPVGATINAIEVIFNVMVSGINSHSNSVKIVKGGSVIGTEHSGGEAWSSTLTYGNLSNDLWGVTWADTDIRSSGFGFAISAIAGGGSNLSLVSATVIVNYTPAAVVVAGVPVNASPRQVTSTIRIQPVAEAFSITAAAAATPTVPDDVSVRPSRVSRALVAEESLFSPAIKATITPDAIEQPRLRQRYLRPSEEQIASAFVAVPYGWETEQSFRRRERVAKAVDDQLFSVSISISAPYGWEIDQPRPRPRVGRPGDDQFQRTFPPVAAAFWETYDPIAARQQVRRQREEDLPVPATPMCMVGINIPILTVTDNGDGTGGVAHVSGSTGGTTNTIWVAPYSQGGLVFTNEGARVGDGTVPIALSPGNYIGYITSTLGTASTDSAAIAFTLTAIPTGTANGGGPVLVKKNPFQPMCWAKTPQGDIIGVNGIDQGVMWDGYNNFPTAPVAYNLGIAPPGVPASVVTNASAGGAVAGAYNFYYRFLDFSGRYSTLSPVTTVQANNGDAFVWAVAASNEPTRVVTLELWRTISGGANRVYKVTSFPNATQSFTDTLSDSTLENAAIADPTTTMLLVNGDGTFDALRFIPPPTNKAVVVWFQNRAFYCADVLYTTGQVDVTNGSPTVVGVNTAWVPQFIGRYFYASGAPRGYLIDNVASGASNVQMTVAGSPPNNETQTIQLPAATCGTWTWTLDGHTTTALAYNASAAAVQAAITALVNVGTGNAVVSGTSPYVVNFQGTLSNTAIDLATADGSSLCGIPAPVTRVVAGSAGGGGGGTANETQVVGFMTVFAGGVVAAIQSADGGQFYLTFNGHSTAPIQVHPDPSNPNAGPTAAQIQALLQALPSIGTGNCSVVDLAFTGAIGGVCGAPLNANSLYGAGVMAWQVTYTGALAGEDVPQMTITITPDVLSSGVKAPSCAPPLNNCTVQAIQCTTQNGSGGGGGGGGSAANEIQEISLPPGTASGTFTLTTNGHTTAAIAWNATGATVQSALNTATGGSNFLVTGGAGGPYLITFQGIYADTPESLIVVNTTSLNGGTIATKITVQGSPGVDCVQTLYLGTPTAGTYTLTFNGATTTPIAYNANVATIQAAFVALGTVGSGNCVVANTTTGIYTFTFEGALDDSAQPLITADLHLLTGAAVIDVITLANNYGGATGNLIGYTIRPAPQERNVVYFSEVGEGESVPNGDPAVPDSDPNSANSIKCQQFTERDDEIVGAFNHGPFCYFLQNNHLILFDYQSNPKLDGNFSLVATRGAFNNRCWATIGDVAFLMDREGAYVLQAGTVQPISEDVQNYWREQLMDFSQSSKFFVSTSPRQKVARFFYCTPGQSYPQQALCFNAVTRQWWPESYHEPMGAQCVYPISGAWRSLLGGKSGLVHLAGQGSSDVVDSTTETGTMAGTVTAATTNTLTDSTATFRDTMIGAPVAIISGFAKGQENIVLSHTGTQFNFVNNWGVTPAVGDSYRVGAIPWTYKTGNLPLVVQPVAGDEEQPQELGRGVRIVWGPTNNKAYFDIRHWFDNDQSPAQYYSNIDQGDGLRIALNDVSAVQEMTLDRDTVDQVAQAQIGYTRHQFDSGGSDFSITRRYVTVMLTGFQCQDSIRFFSLDGLGVEQE